MLEKPVNKLEEFANKLERAVFVRCPLCHLDLVVKRDKKGKFYLVCFSCWMQIFVRGENGIKRLKKRMHRYG